MELLFEKNISFIMRLILKRLSDFSLGENKKVGDCLNKISKNLPKGIQTKEYYKEGKYPIIDQGQNFIAGYSDNDDIVDFDLPLIVFGDHTRNIKYIDFPFVIGADGVKLYKPQETIDEKFFYYALNGVKLDSRGYGRHNKLMQESYVYIPQSKKLQKNIVSFLEDLKNGRIKEEEYFSKSIEKEVFDFLSNIKLVNSYQNNQIFDKDLVKKLRQSILQDAIQGKLVPQDPADEPVSELLKKIQIEKESLIKGKKIKGRKNLTPITENGKSFALPKGWEWIRFENLFEGSQNSKSKQIKSTEIFKEGAYPVIDQGKSFISGYSNSLDNLIKIRKPIIIFGDHTREVKYIEFDFIPGADGTQILVPLDMIVEKYFYYVIKNFNLESRGYARHFKLLKEQICALPPLAEQHRIVTKVDELMKFCDSLEKEITEAKENGERLMESVLGEVFR